jgi:hypothetical protein
VRWRRPAGAPLQEFILGYMRAAALLLQGLKAVLLLPPRSPRVRLCCRHLLPSSSAVRIPPAHLTWQPWARAVSQRSPTVAVIV